MTVESKVVRIETREEGEMLDIIEKVHAVVRKGTIILDCCQRRGRAWYEKKCDTVLGEPDLLTDLPSTLERIVPPRRLVRHQRRWNDGNGHSHIRASLIGPDLSVPFEEKKLMLGTWQQIVFTELDVRPRDRTIILHSMERIVPPYPSLSAGKQLQVIQTQSR